jgi:membrane protein
VRKFVKQRFPKTRIWKSIRLHLHLLLNAAKKFNQDHGFFLASGITFNLLMYLIPFTMLLLAMIGTYLYNDQKVLNHIRDYLRRFTPSIDLTVMENLFELIQNRQIVGILGIAGLIWISTWVFGSLRTALNIVFRVEKSRGFFRGLGIDLSMIFLAGILLLLSMILTPIITVIDQFGGALPFVLGPGLQWILKYLVPFGFTYVTFFLIYKIIPNTKVDVLSILKAALFAGLLWEFAKHLFGWYAAHLTRYSVIYGSLSTLIIFFFWVYYSAAILLLGGEFAFLIELKRTKGQPEAPMD